MRMILPVLAGLLIAPGLCVAQAAPGTMSQNAQVILETQAAGLFAAHSDVQAGTEIKITNEANGKVITATAVERLPKSYGRVVSLSPDAAKQLGVARGDWVKITVASQRPTGQTAPGSTDATPSHPGGNVTINNYYYVFDPDKLPELVNKSMDFGRDDPFMEGAAVTPAAPAHPPRPDNHEIDNQTENVDVNQTENADINKTENVNSNGIHIIDLPNPRSKKYYRLQVGAYRNNDMAQAIYQKVANGGFKPEIEHAGAVYRVCVPKVAAADVLAEAHRLGALGFKEIWVREEK